MLLGGGSDLLGMLAVVGIVGLVQALADGSQEAASVNAVGLLSGAALSARASRSRSPLRMRGRVGRRARRRPGSPSTSASSRSRRSPQRPSSPSGRPASTSTQASLIAAGVLAGVVYFAIAAAAPLAIAARIAGTSVWNAWRGHARVATAADGRRRPPRRSRRHRVRQIRPLDAGADRGAAPAGPLDPGPGGVPRPAPRRRAAVARRCARSPRRRRLPRERGAARALHGPDRGAHDADRRAETAGHSREVQRLAVAVGNELRLSNPELEVLAHAALLHDLGKLAVPDAVLLKDEELSEETGSSCEATRARVRRSSAGSLPGRRRPGNPAPPRAVRRSRVSGRAVRRGDPARRAHHPRRRGDRLDARCHPQSPDAGRDHRRARRCAGTQFCPRCVDAMEAIADAGLLTGFRRPGELEHAR